MLSDSERNLIARFADEDGRAKRPVKLDRATKKETEHPMWRVLWPPLLVAFCTYLVVGLLTAAILSIGGLTKSENSAATATAVIFAIAVTSAFVFLRVRLAIDSKRLAKDWAAAHEAQIKADGDLFETVATQVEYAENLATSYGETFDGRLRGVFRRTAAADSAKPALLVSTDQSVLVTVLTDRPIDQGGVEIPREHHRVPFTADYENWNEPRLLWGSPADPNVITIHLDGGRFATFRSIEAWGTTEFLDAIEQAANTVRQSVDLPVLPSLHKGPQPPKRLVRDAAEAEEMVTLWVRWLGWPDAVRTRATADGGIDVIGTGHSGLGVAQVKFEAKPAGRPSLQALYGAGHGEGASSWLYFNSAGYSPQALEWADQVGMSLFSFTLDGGVEPANASARRLFD